MGFKFLFQSCKTLCIFLKAVKNCVCLRDSGREFQTVGSKTEKDLFPKVSREKPGIVSREASRERNVLEGQYR